MDSVEVQENRMERAKAARVLQEGGQDAPGERAKERASRPKGLKQPAPPVGCFLANSQTGPRRCPSTQTGPTFTDEVD